MPLTSAQLVRQRIQDEPQLAIAAYHGDGTAAQFALPHRNLTSASAFVPLGGTAWSATGAAFDPSGWAAFSGVISAGSAFQVRYVHSVFSDAVLDHYLSAHGSVAAAALHCAYDLQFDALKRAAWAAPDGTTYDDRDARSTLREIISALRAELREDALAGGALWSWAETQGER